MKRFTKFLYVLAGLVLMGYGFLSYDLLFWGRVPAWLTLQQIVYIALAGFILTVLIGFLLFAKGFSPDAAYPPSSTSATAALSAFRRKPCAISPMLPSSALAAFWKIACACVCSAANSPAIM